MCSSDLNLLNFLSRFAGAYVLDRCCLQIYAVRADVTEGFPRKRFYNVIFGVIVSKTIVLGSDHGGLNLKKVFVKALEEWGYSVEDEGPDCFDSCDYPLFAAKVVDKVKADDGKLGVLICGTGQGMTMTANRMGVRAALCTNEFLAEMAREHNDARILCRSEERRVGKECRL